MGSKKKYGSKRKKQLIIKRNIGAGIAAVILVILALIAFRQSAPSGVGQAVKVLRMDHVENGQPVESPSDPPTSGSHYASAMPAGFYTEDSPEYLSGDYDGYLIHSLEHGYVIFWYNCQLLDAQGCSELQADIQSVMDEFNGKKLIAFPRHSLDVPLVMTSWGYLQEFSVIDPGLVRQFISTNQPLAPELDAP